MRLMFAAVALTLMVGSQAMAAGQCKTERLSCATTMPVGGYCECTAKGVTEDGTVMERTRTRAPAPAKTNATSGGCGTQPNAAGCR